MKTRIILFLFAFALAGCASSPQVSAYYEKVGTADLSGLTEVYQDGRCKVYSGYPNESTMVTKVVPHKGMTINGEKSSAIVVISKVDMALNVFPNPDDNNDTIVQPYEVDLGKCDCDEMEW